VTFEHAIRVRFHQADPAGVLFYGRLFELVEETYEELCRAAGLDIDAMMQLRGSTTPVVHLEADFRTPIAVGETVVVRAVVERVGSTSITVGYTLVGSGGEVRATARIVHVHVDAATWRTTPIPDDVRARLEAFRATA
jgi:4-hydroxybenzoyl-CoA thioesterase